MNVATNPAAMTAGPGWTADIGIAGMTCASCVRRIERAIRVVPGVQDLPANLATEHARVEGSLEAVAVVAAVVGAGYLELDEVAGVLPDGKADAVARLASR